MKDSVLCAIDFSESSEHVLQWAYKMAAGVNAPLAVLYAYRLIQTGKAKDILLFKKKTEEDAQKKFSALKKYVMDGHYVPVHFITEIGFFSDNIENYIRKNPNSMVVMSDALADSLYEHKNLSILRFTKDLQVPLLIVPNPERTGRETVFAKKTVKVL